MLSDDELQALRDIERRLRWDSPQLVQLFNSAHPQPETNHRRRARTRVLLAAAALAGLALLGPRMLNEAEIRTQQRRPLPRTAPSDTTIARRTDPVLGLAALTAPSRSPTHSWRRQPLSQHRCAERPDVLPLLEPELTNDYRNARAEVE